MNAVSEEERLRLAHAGFVSRMMLKLLEKLNEGWDGWDKSQKYPDSNLENRLKRAVRLRKWENVANFAMFLWYNREKEKDA